MRHTAIRRFAADSPEGIFLKRARDVLAEDFELSGSSDPLQELFYRTRFPQRFFGFALAVYQPNARRILLLHYGPGNYEILRAVVNRIRIHPRRDEFNFDNPEVCRFQIDFIVDKPISCSFSKLSQDTLGPLRFEIGVDGLVVAAPQKREWFLPGDAFVESILTLHQLRSHLAQRFTVPFEQLSVYRFQSKSFISFGEDWLFLYRGYPVLKTLHRADYLGLASAGVDFILRTQKYDGRFAYYYDAHSDTHCDHEHPKRDPKKNPYYNILRHIGGALTLLHDYRLRGDSKLLDAIRRAIDFMLAQLRTYHTTDGESAAYIFYNRKAKLGSSGLALYLLCELRRLTNSNSYDEWIHKLSRHLTAMIQPSGEFLYYWSYLGRAVDATLNQRLFSFYYPGEALIGLVSYYQTLATEADRDDLAAKIHATLHFLIDVRPDLYRKHYRSLPADSWLMMAINHLWDVPKLRRNPYRDFVFTDADRMVDHMYTDSNALYSDYEGAFFYTYGDHPFPDGARAEGLLAGYELARKVSDEDRSKRYWLALERVSWALAHLCNTPESVYCLCNPKYALGGIRFKLTRQWFRVDTIQHVASFCLKSAPYRDIVEPSYLKPLVW